MAGPSDPAMSRGVGCGTGRIQRSLTRSASVPPEKPTPDDLSKLGECIGDNARIEKTATSQSATITYPRSRSHTRFRQVQAFPLTSMSIRSGLLVHELQRELHLAGSPRFKNVVECRRTDVAVGQPEIGAVEDIKQFGAELQPL